MLSRLRSFPQVRSFTRAFGTTQEFKAPTKDINAKKTSFVSTYIEKTPTDYANRLSLLDYGQFQNNYVAFCEDYINKIKISNNISSSNKITLMDLGALYGNTTLGTVLDMSWNDTVQFWNDNCNWTEEQQNIKDEWYTVGVDLSQEALNYGLEHNIYDETYIQNFNDNLDPNLGKRLDQTDILVCLMANNYMKDGRFKEIIELFINNRSKDKVLFYNNVSAFDKRDYIPEVLLQNVKNWEFKNRFLKHRNFTPDESSAHDGNRESWTHLYGVYFNKQ